MEIVGVNQTAAVGLGRRTMVVSGDFCVAQPMELKLKKKNNGQPACPEIHFEAIDVNGNRLLRVDGMHIDRCWDYQQMFLFDPTTDLLILTLEKKDEHNHVKHKWIVYCGKSKERKQLYSVQRSEISKLPLPRGEASPNSFHVESRFKIFLGNHPAVENEPDFLMVKRWSPPSQASIKVYKKDTIIAEAKDGNLWDNYCTGKGEFLINVSPGVDYAFVTTLFIIAGDHCSI